MSVNELVSVLEVESDVRLELEVDELEVEVVKGVLSDLLDVKVELDAPELENNGVDCGEDCGVLDVVGAVDIRLVDVGSVVLSVVRDGGAGDALWVVSGT